MNSDLRTRQMVRLIVPALAFLVAWRYAHFTLANTFRTYDDEGYALLSLRNYLHGSALYQDVFSHYGLFHFQVQKAVFSIFQLAVTHDAGRTVTLSWWLISASLAGYSIYTLSRNILLGCAAGLVCTKLASVLASEPGHPQQLIFAIIIAAFCVCVHAPRDRQFFLLGALGAALFFTKINVGIFYFAALAHLLVALFPPGRTRTMGRLLLYAYALASPLLLMHRDLREWAAGFCVMAILCGVSAVRAGSLDIAPPAPRPARPAVFATAGAFCGAFLIVAIAVLQGMSIATLLEGTLWGPLRQPGKFTRPLFLPPLAIPAAALIPLALAALHQFRTRSQAQLRLVAAVRFAVGAFTIALLMETPNAMVWALPFLPLGLIPVTGRGWKLSEWIPRIFIVAMATTEFLQGYPVAGSQMGAAALPLLLWAFIAMHDGLAGLSSHSGRASSVSAESFAWQPVIAGLIALVSITTRYGPAFWPPGYLDPPSHLRGSASLHLSSSAEHRYQQIAGNIRANCDSLFTMPGMGSLNLWSGVPAPNGLNTTGWMRTFSPEQQQQLLRLLQANTHGCAIYNADLAGFWGSPRASLDSLPLARYILYEMPEIAEVEGYEIHVHPNRPMPWLTAR